MRELGLRSPASRVGGIVYFGRMLDKIRQHQKGQLPSDYQANRRSDGESGRRCWHWNHNLIRRRGRSHPVIDKFPDRDHHQNYRDRRDPPPQSADVWPVTGHYSESVSIRSANAKSSSVSPPLLWVESTSRTLL